MPPELLPDGKGGFVTPADTAPARPALVEAIEKLTALANAPAPAGGEEEIAKAVSEVVADLYIKPIPSVFEPLEKADYGALNTLVTAAVAKLNELGAVLAIPPVDPVNGYNVKWQIVSALEGLVAITEAGARAEWSLNKNAPADAPPAPAVEEAPATTGEKLADTANADIEKYRAIAKSLQITLDSCKGIADDTQVSDTSFDPTAAAKLLDESTKVIKSLQQRVVALEGAVVTPNALPVEVVTKSAHAEVWPSDMAQAASELSF